MTVSFSGNSVWRNNITGAGGLVKQGGGALSLSGANTYAGATRIERGTLALRDGGSIRSNVTIAAQADPSQAALQFMSGANKVTGNVDNGGSVVLLSGGSSSTIDGNYVQTDNATFAAELSPPDLADLLQVSGNANLLGGTLLAIRSPGTNPVTPAPMASISPATSSPRRADAPGGGG